MWISIKAVKIAASYNETRIKASVDNSFTLKRQVVVFYLSNLIQNF